MKDSPLRIAFILLLVGGAVSMFVGLALTVNWAFPGIWQARNDRIEDGLSRYTAGCISQGFSKSQCEWLDNNFKPMWR